MQILKRFPRTAALPLVGEQQAYKFRGGIRFQSRVAIYFRTVHLRSFISASLAAWCETACWLYPCTLAHTATL